MTQNHLMTPPTDRGVNPRLYTPPCLPIAEPGYGDFVWATWSFGQSICVVPLICPLWLGGRRYNAFALSITLSGNRITSRDYCPARGGRRRKLGERWAIRERGGEKEGRKTRPQ